MKGGFLRHGGGAAVNLPLSRLRALPFSGELSKASWTRARTYLPSRLLCSKFKEPRASSLLTPSFPPVTAVSFSSSRLVSWYLCMIGACPLLTKSVTAAAISVAADIFSQMITLSTSDSVDFLRTLRMAGYGMFISGPSLHFWFIFVSRILPKRDILTTFKKVALAQAIYGPIITGVFFSLNAALQGYPSGSISVNYLSNCMLAIYGPIITGVFFSLNAALQGETSAEIFARLKRDLIPTLKSGVAYWPVCDFITFKFFPVRMQPLASNLFSFLWTVYMTYMASLEKASIENIPST